MTTDINSSLQAFEILKPHFNSVAEEVWVISLNSQLQVLGTDMIFRGTADHCLIHPRDIFRCLILKNASSFILAHNHPSKDATPSEQDLILTRKIHNGSLLFQIPMQDHVIFTGEHYFSMADQGFFKKWAKSFRSISSKYY